MARYMPAAPAVGAQVQMMRPSPSAPRAAFNGYAASAASPAPRPVAAPGTRCSNIAASPSTQALLPPGSAARLPGRPSTQAFEPSAAQQLGAGAAPVRLFQAAAAQPQAPHAPQRLVQQAQAAHDPSQNGSQRRPSAVAPDSELAHLLLLLRNPNLLSQCATKCFRLSDSDGNGVLSLDELLELMPMLHKEIGLSIVEDSDDVNALVRSRMRKFDVNGDGVLSLQEFLELYRWTLWLKYEDLDPPIQKRSELIKGVHKGSPSTYYAIGAQIGQGQFGIVNLARRFDTGAERVLKTINKRTAVQSGTPLAMLSQEMDILALLDHPHILRLFEHYNDTENIYIVTDVCYGGHLLEIVQEHCEQRVPMPEGWVARFFKQALEAVGYCHSKGVMHKDIKFENLMLNKKVTCDCPLEDIHVIVIDVGLSELFGPLHSKEFRSNVIAGSPATMAPEVIRRDFSFKCDIWSFGCLLYAIFNNTPAYLPDGAGGQVLYTYPFAPVQTEADPFGIEGLLRSQMNGPPMDRIQGVSWEAQGAVCSMLTCDERMRPSARECVDLPWFTNYNPKTVFSLSEEQVKTLVQDREVNILRRTVLLEAATQLPVSAVLELEREFEALAASTGGTQIDCAVLAGALERKGVPRDVADKVVEVADLDRSGMIEWSEFVAAMLPACHELFAESLQRVFQEYDVDHNGHLDRQEVAAMLQEGSIDSMHMPLSKTVDMMIEELDDNHDGKISFSEFHNYLLRVDGNA